MLSSVMQRDSQRYDSLKRHVRQTSSALSKLRLQLLCIGLGALYVRCTSNSLYLVFNRFHSYQHTRYSLYVARNCQTVSSSLFRIKSWIKCVGTITRQMDFK